MNPSSLLLLLILAGANGDGADPADRSPGAPRFHFVDVAPRAGIDVRVVSGDPRRWYIVESNGSGAAWLDHDGDGDMDLYVANGARLRYLEDGARLEVVRAGSSRLYRNDGRLSFTDVTDEAGARRSDWTNAVATADVEGDGDVDLYLAGFGPDAFLENEGGRFREAAAEAGLANELWGAGAAFADPDRDGDLDLYVANYVLFDLERPPDGGRRATIEGVEVAWGPEGEHGRDFNRGAPDRYFENQGDGRFREATRAAGLELEDALCSYACVFADFDDDGWADLAVANDLQPANLFMNRGDGRFRDEAKPRGFAFTADGEVTSAMGLFVADADGDGDLDALRTNFDLEANSLHLNDGSARFVERTARHGLAAPSEDRLAWGGGFFDADHDGDLDLLIANGHVMPQAAEIGMHPWAQRSQLFEAVAHEEHGTVWRDVTGEAGPGLEPLRSSRGVALGDPDDDGDLDALVVDIDHAPRLLENRSARRGRWIGLRLVGAGGNRDAYGARVTVEAGGRSWMAEVRSADGLFSARDPRLVFGLGALPEGERVERVTVRWPRGRVQVARDLPLDRYVELREPAPGEPDGS